MAAPDYVPPTYADKPRAALPIPPPGRWTADRPADLRKGQPFGRTLGRPGPDQGYALSLAERFHDRLRLADGEHREDVVAGCVALAMRRASLFGRAPVVHDLDLAFGLFGFLGDAPAELVAWRKPAFRGAAHDYWVQRGVVDAVPEAALRSTPADLRARQAEWSTLTGAGAG